MKFRVGILDDEPLVREGIKAKLKFTDLEYEVVFEHEDGHVALEFLRKAEVQPIDIMVVDILMPRLPGLEFIKQAKEIWPDIHFIIASGYNDFPYAKTALKLGVDDYLMKPIMTEELIVTISTIKTKLKHEQATKEADFKNEIAHWILQKGNVTLNQSTAFFLKECIIGNSNLYLVMAGNFHSTNQAILESDSKLGEFSFPIYEGGSHNLMVYLHYSHHFATQLLQSSQSSTLTIIHFSTIHSVEQLPDLIYFGLNQIRDTLVLDEHKCLQFKPSDILVEKHWKDVNEDYAALIEKMKQERRYEVALELLKNGLSKKLPQKVKEQLFQLFMSNIFRMEVYPEWLQSFESSGPFTKACLELVKTVKNEPWPISGKDILREVLADIEKQFSLRKSLQDYADDYEIHPNHLARLFKKQLNITFLEHLTKVRLEKAKDLLLNKKLSISEIALEVGYEDARYFSQVFRRHFYCTPSEFRN